MRNAVGLSMVAGLVVGLGLPLGGCTIDNQYGVDIQNHTGQLLMVEFLDVKSDGTTSVYSTAKLAPKGSFTNRMPYVEQGFGKRLRFSLPERPAEDLGARVELKLPEDSSRYYDLKLKNGRLMAEEFAKGRTPTASSELTGGWSQ